MPILSMSGVSHIFGAERILDNVSCTVERGEHIGLVGTNGAGKSTLLRILAGELQPDAGVVSRARNLRVSYLPQEPDFDAGSTLFDVMLEPFKETADAQELLRLIESDLAAGKEDPALMEEYAELQIVVEGTGYDYTARVERVLTGLDLPEPLWAMPVSHLSGGQRTRANLGRTLLREADILLLDEPTNHLDIPAVEWLQSYLKELSRAFVIVAHDRYLLDAVTQRTIELSQGKVHTYDAPYVQYLALRAEHERRRQVEYESQQAHIAKTEDFIRRYGAGQRYKEARGRQKQLDRLERVERPHDDRTAALNLRGPHRSGDIVLDMRDLRVGYGDTMLFRMGHEVVVQRGDHVALVGANGTGKTTLLRTLMGALVPISGTYRWGTGTTIGYFSQSAETLDDRRSILEEIRHTAPLDEETARGFLGRFLFTGDDASKQIATLSGGERSRVALAKLILQEPNVLLLDEPTNHLDIASREALQDVLAQFAGTIIFVSHDRYLIDTLAHQVWVVADSAVRRYAGTYSEYASGSAPSLDAAASTRENTHTDLRESPVIRLTALQEQVETLSSRLAQSARTASISQLAELSEDYAVALGQLREVEDEWLLSMHRQVRSSLA